jgi:hypothetical protein
VLHPRYSCNLLQPSNNNHKWVSDHHISFSCFCIFDKLSRLDYAALSAALKESSVTVCWLSGLQAKRLDWKHPYKPNPQAGRRLFALLCGGRSKVGRVPEQYRWRICLVRKRKRGFMLVASGAHESGVYHVI